jgi:alpha-tubulin suppressor-like RCC1 family protein
MLLKEQLLASGQYQVALTSNKLFVWGYGVTGGATTTLNLFSLAQISAGNSHALALTSDNRLLAWGLNSNGQLGTNDAISRSFPAQVGGKGGWKKISAGASFSVVVRGDGTLFAWGNNASGQLGDGTTITKSSPVQIASSVNWLNVDAGIDHVIATNNTALLWVWGKNDAGQLGVNDTINRSFPVQVSSPTLIGSNSWLQLSAGLSFSAAIDTDYKLYAWGLNSSGQLGLTNVNINGDTINRSIPTQVGTLSWQLVSAGQGHTAAIRLDSTLWTWGLNTSFQLGLTDTGPAGSSINRSAPVRVTSGSGSGSWKNVSAGNAFTLAIANDPLGLTDNLLFSWGRNQEGQTGFVNSTTLRSTPQQITTGSWALISAGSSFSIATNNNKLLYTWGAGAGGTQADGVVSNRSSPVLVSFRSVNSQSSPVQVGTSSWTFVSAGYYYNLAIRADGTLWGWGENLSGQLGINNAITRSSPVQIGTSSWTTVSARNGTQTYAGTAAIRSDNTLWVWGQGAYQFGATTVSQSWQQVTNGPSHSVAIRSDGSLWAWGLNSSGQIGDNTTISKSTPVQIGTLSNYVQVGTGKTDSSFAINTLGNLYTWGLNSTGNLGLNDTINRSSPTLVSTNDTSWTFVSGTKGITNDGKLYSWGNNDNGQVGDGTTINQSLPTQIIAGTSFVFTTGSAIARNLAITTTGTLYAWGLNNSGALGDNSTINKSTPVQITFSKPVSYNYYGTYLGGAGGNTNGSLALTTGSDGAVLMDTTSGPVGTLFSSISPAISGKTSWAASDGNIQITSYGTYTFTASQNFSLPVYMWGAGGGAINYSLGVYGGGGGFSYGEITFASGSSYRMIIGQGGMGGASNRGGGGGGGGTGIEFATTSTPVLVAGGGGGGYISSGLGGGGGGTNAQAGGNGTDASGGAGGTQSGPGAGGAGGRASGSAGSGRNGGNGAGNGGGGAIMLGGVGFGNGGNGVSDSSNQGGGGGGGGYFGGGGGGMNNGGAAGGGGSGYFNPTYVNSALLVTANFYIPADRVKINYSSGDWNYVATNTDTTTAGHSLGLTNGILYVWGGNNTGQLGDGTTINKSNPVLLSPDFYYLNVAKTSVSWTAAVPYASATAGIDQLGQLFTWGSDSGSRLGDNLTVNRSSPILISGGGNYAYSNNSWKILDASVSTSGVVQILSDNGSIFGWGQNTSGVLGDSTTVSKTSPIQVTSLFLGNYSSPVQVGTRSNWTQVSLGYVTIAAINSLGELYCWGPNSTYGTDGSGILINRLAPFKIGNSSWTQVSQGFMHTAAITSDNRLFVWGRNDNYQLGDDTNASKSSPIQIGVSTPFQIGTGSFVQVAAGTHYTMAVDTNKKLYAWGYNLYGQLGIITDAYSWNMIREGFGHALAIRSDNTLWGWGRNDLGALGQNDTITRSSPVQIGTSSWTQISATQYTSAAIRSDGKLFVWGYGLQQNGWGDGTLTQNISSPTQIGNSSWSLVATGYSHMLGIDANGRLFGWGTGASLFGTTAIFSWTTVSTNSSYTTAIRSDGLLFTWGLNSNGQLGDGTTLNKSSPTQLGNSSWNAVTAGVNHVLGITSNGNLYSWGNNAQQQLGDNTSINKSSPVLIDSGSWIAVAAGNSTSMAIKSPNLLYTWGLGSSGQLGQLTASQSWNDISAGVNNVLAVRNDNLLFSWGNNTSYKLALGETGDIPRPRSSPVLINSSVSTSSWSKVAAGATHSLGISSDGKLYGWGYNNRAQIYWSNDLYSWRNVTTSTDWWYAIKQDYTLWVWGGSGSGESRINTFYANQISSPTQIGTSSWSMITMKSLYSAGWNTTAAGITVNGLLYMWGVNTSGQLGDNSSINKSSPVQIGTGSWAQISTSAPGHTLGIKSDGSLWAWGLNSSGQLGLTNINAGGDIINRSSPVQLGLNSWKNVSSGYNHSAAIRNDDTLWVWGSNNVGQLGTNDTINRSSPVQVTLPTTGSWAAVACGSSTTFAITLPGLGTPYSVYAWGYNASTNLGITTPGYTNTNKSSPVLVLAGAAGASFIQVATNHYDVNQAVGGFGVAALNSNGKIWNWGNNDGGQLGDLSIINKSSPVQVSGSVSFTQLSKDFGISAIAGISNENLLYIWGSNITNALELSLNVGTISVSSPVMVGPNVMFGVFRQPTYTINSQPGQGSWTYVAAGFNNSFGIKNNLLYAWGYNLTGQTGTNQTGDFVSSPTQVGSNSYIMVTTNTNNQFAAAITSDYKLYMWGGVHSGIPTQQNQGVPQLATTVLQPTFSWTQFAFGTAHMLAIKSDGGLYVWGQNQTGCLGLGVATGENRSSPTQLGTNSWLVVAAGDNNSWAIRTDGTMWAWGDSKGQGVLGTNNTISYSSPVQVAGSWANVVSGGTYRMAAAIDSSGSLYMWGNNFTGSLGVGDTIDRSSPTFVGFNYKVISIGNLTSAGITSSGALFTWGRNNRGQLGLGDTIDRSNPTQVGDVNLHGQWSTVAVLGDVFPDNASVLGIRFNSTLWSWGYNSIGQLGTNNTISYSSPVQVGTKSWVQISGINGDKVFAIDDVGQLYAWGNNTFTDGVLGLGDTISRSNPTLVPNPVGTSWTRVMNHSGAGQYTNFVLAANNNLYATGGQNFAGLFGSSDVVPVNGKRSTPTQLAGNYTQMINPYSYSFLRSSLAEKLSSPVQVGNDSWISVGTGNNFTIGVRSDRTLWSWGFNTSLSQLGLGDTNVRSSPTQIGNDTDWDYVAIGDDSSFAVKTNKTLYAWGNNNIGQLGKGSLEGTQSWIFISNGSSANHFLAIRNDNKLFAWGLNTWGQLGTGDKISRSRPTLIGNSSWSVVAANWSHSVGITADGKLFTWGTNDTGRLGNGLTTDRSSPIQVTGAGGTLNTTSWSAVACGLSSTYAITTTGSLYSWGDSQYGQLGYGTAASRSSPTLVSGTWTKVAAGDNSAYAINNLNVLYSWGRNEAGQLGDSTTINKSTPVNIGSWTAVAAGSSHTVALSPTAIVGYNGIVNDLSGTAGNPGNSGPTNNPITCNGQDGKIYFDINAGTGINPGDIIFTSISPAISGKTSWTLADGAISIDLNGTYTFVGGINCDIPVYMWGAGGGAVSRGANTAGGQGGYTGGKVTFSSSTSYRMIIGQGGAGGSYFRNAGAGGGGTGIEFATTSTPVLVAGGGGGGLTAIGLGGGGGGTNAQAGATVVDGLGPNNTGGGGGSQVAPGAGGTGPRRTGASGIGRNGGEGNTGSLAFAGGTGFGNGGYGAFNGADNGSGGGGGGYYGGGEGGGGSDGAPGGGGSGYINPTYVSEGITVTANYNYLYATNIYSWGLNSSGQLGNNATINRSSPVQVNLLQPSSLISASLNNTFAVTTLNTRLYAWGNNTNGILGDGTTINKSAPTQISNPVQVTSWSSIGAGQAVFGLASDNLLYGWGLNANGQLSTLSTINRSQATLLGNLPDIVFSQPVQISGSWSAISAGSSFTVAKDMDNNIYTWGLDSSGQLGLG